MKVTTCVTVALFLFGCEVSETRSGPDHHVTAAQKCAAMCPHGMKKVVVNWSGFIDECECHAAPEAKP